MRRHLRSSKGVRKRVLVFAYLREHNHQNVVISLLVVIVLLVVVNGHPGRSGRHPHRQRQMIIWRQIIIMQAWGFI